MNGLRKGDFGTCTEQKNGLRKLVLLPIKFDLIDCLEFGPSIVAK